MARRHHFYGSIRRAPDPRIEKFNQRTDYLRANADPIVATTIARINANPDLKRGFDLMQKMGFPAANLVALVYFESSGGLLTGNTKSSAKGAFQLVNKTFYDDFRRFATPQNIERLRAVAPEVAHDFEQAQAAGGVTLKTDPRTGHEHVVVAPAARPYLDKYRKDDFVHMFFTSENVRIHQGQAAGNLENLRLMNNWGVAGMNRILAARPNEKMGELFNPRKTSALQRNHIPPDLTVRDFLAQERDLFKYFTARAQAQLDPQQGTAVANTGPPAAAPTPSAPSASPPTEKLAGASAFTVERKGNEEIYRFVDQVAVPARETVKAHVEPALPPPAPSRPSRHGAIHPPPRIYAAPSRPRSPRNISQLIDNLRR